MNTTTNIKRSSTRSARDVPAPSPSGYTTIGGIPTKATVINPADLIEIEQGGVSKQASASMLPSADVPDPLTVNTLNIGTHARLVATATGMTLQCFDGTNWIDQITYTAIPGT
jgi:hypothetical protein